MKAPFLWAYRVYGVASLVSMAFIFGRNILSSIPYHFTAVEYFNAFGEGWPEVVLFFATVPYLVILIADTIREIVR